MRILMLAQGFEPAQGGGPRWTTELAHGLARRGNDVLVVTRDYDEARGVVHPRERLEVDYRALPIVRGSPIFTAATLRPYVGRFRPDVIQTSAPSLADALMPRPARLSDVPYATLFHARLGASLPAKIVERVNLARLRRDWRAVAVTSSYWADWLAARGVRRDRLHVIPSTVNDRFASGPLPGIARDPGALLFVGGLADVQSYKRFDLLLDAAALLAEKTPDLAWHLDVVGDGPLRATYRAAAIARGLGARIAFLGRVDDARLHDLYSRAALLVLPSCDPREGWGLVLAEASCCGAPVLFTDGIGGAGTFRDAPGATVVPAGDVDAMARGIAARLSLGSDGLDRERSVFGERFHATAVVEAYERMYASLIR